MDFFISHISANAKKEVEEILDSTFVSAGKKVEEFETALNRFVGIINPVTVNSGTTALHLALVVAGIRPGDEVIIPSQTFIATGLSVLMAGAMPVFADIQSDTGNIDPKAVVKKITPKTKAIIPVHWGGYPCDMDEIQEIANQYDLIVIEDAAHAIGATYKGKPVGSISDFTTFSFQAIKHITTGDGGALACLKDEDYEEAVIKRWFGIDRNNTKASLFGARMFEIKELGYKYHMNNYAAALGLANLNDINMILEKRRSNARILRKELKNIPGLGLLNYKSDRKSAFWLFTVLVDNRSDFVNKLKEKGIPSSVVDFRIDKNPVFGEVDTDLKGQEMFEKKQISLPIHQQLTDDDIHLIIDTIKKGW